MKIKLKNVGVIRQAELELGDLTIICGGNNTGKTYVTYALFGFLDGYSKFLTTKITDDFIELLLDKGVADINLEKYSDQVDDILEAGSKEYTKSLSKVFASSEDLFKNSSFKISSDGDMLPLKDSFKQIIGSKNAEMLSISKEQGDNKLSISLLTDNRKIDLSKQLIKRIISQAIINILFDDWLPNPFISSAERTGTTIFNDELNFSRNSLLKDLHNLEADENPRELLRKNYRDYPLPVEKNVDFIRKIPKITKNISFISRKYPEILAEFNDIIGGEYRVTKNEGLHFKPKGSKAKLSMEESSSSVRSLLDIGFYLRHVAQQGDLLMIDEPELNLHPKNQCRVARLLARLVNLGIKVFITTHSDYIIKEFNTLIMLNHSKANIKKLMKDEGYQPQELLSIEKIKAYIADKEKIKIEGNKIKSLCQTLTLAKIDNTGIEVGSFDREIDKMNEIQDRIIWAEHD